MVMTLEPISVTVNKFEERQALNKKVYDFGFSLLETLVALAILSLVSLAMFQSSLQLISVSQKSVNVADTTIDKYVLHQSFRDLVLSLTPAWAEQPENVFKGGETQFSGLAYFGENVPVEHMTLSMKAVDNINTDIVLQTGEGTFVLGTVLSASLTFTYLGWDQIWYENWPPEHVPSTGFFDDSEFLEIPQMPAAIRLFSDINSFSLVAARRKPENIPFHNDFTF